MSANLTTRARFKSYAQITGTSKDAVIDLLLPMVSGAVERYLRRTLEATTYKTWIDGSGSPVLRLTQYPITAIYSVSISSLSVATVTNNSATVARASVSFDGTNLSLVEISTAGVDTITELPVATDKILTTLQTKIASKAGWSLTLLSSEYGTLPTSMLRPLYSQDALDPSTADLVLPGDPDAVKIVHEDQIELVNASQILISDYVPLGSGITPVTPPNGFPQGTGNVFVWFKAGYTLPTDGADGNLPAGLSLLVNQILWDVMASSKVNSQLTSESIGDYSYSLRATAEGVVGSAIENRKRDLNAYRRVSI